MRSIMAIEICSIVLYTCFGVNSVKSFLKTSSTPSMSSKSRHCFLKVNIDTINAVIPE